MLVFNEENDVTENHRLWPSLPQCGSASSEFQRGTAVDGAAVAFETAIPARTPAIESRPSVRATRCVAVGIRE